MSVHEALAGKSVLVTGANRGIGAAFVEVLIESGVERVYACARDPRSLEEVMRRHGPRLVPVELDVTDPAQVARAVHDCPGVDLLISNAGREGSGRVVGHDEADPANGLLSFLATGTFDGVLDVFGDGSVWALSVPGHTPGSTAYLVRSKAGPVLLTGDACHTRWGWEHHVEPGTFTGDGPRGAESFKKLQGFVAAHPEVEVRLGHQR